jgi:hypothetical protein
LLRGSAAPQKYPRLSETDRYRRQSEMRYHAQARTILSINFISLD